MFNRFTICFKSKEFRLGILLLLLPLLGWGQTTIVNYDFNSTTTPNIPVATAAGISSAASASKASTAGMGTLTGSGAYATNSVAGNALTLTNLNASSIDYFQISLDGASLSKYAAFKLYFQGFRTAMGPTTLTLQYSLNGGTSFSPTTNPPTYVYAPGNPTFTEAGFDLSNLTALNGPTSLIFRLTVGGSTGGNVRIDNFQVQATNTVDPTIGSITPNTVSAGGPNQVITLTGSNFVSGSVVSFNGQNLLTTYNSATSLTATIPAALLAAPGSFPVVVTNSVAGGSTSSAAVAFVVTAVVPRWVGKLGNSWFEPTNWSTGVVPAATDDVLLDHSFVAASYTVSLDQSQAVSIKSLTVNPGVGDSIFAVVPTTNAEPAALTLTNTGSGAVALAIYNKGVVTNASGASSGSGIAISGTSGATAFIYNGGSYRHRSVRGHAAVAENLSAVAGTELGIFDIGLPSGTTASYALSTSGRTYGTLILRSRPGQAGASYPGAGTSLTIQGNLLIGPNVTFSPTINNDLRVGGDIRVQGTMQFKNTTPPSTTSQLMLAGTKPQIISGNILLDPGVGLAIANPTGVALATPLLLNGPLTLTTGILTTSATNLLTLTSTATISGGSNASFVNGPLARATTGAGSTVFPIGRGTTYRPLTLTATTQAVATIYTAVQTEGAPTDQTLVAPLTRISKVRYYSVTPTPAPAANGGFSGTIQVSFGSDDAVTDPSIASLVVAKSDGSGWTSLDRSAYSSTTLTSGVFTSFSDFTLASTDPSAVANPLPVTLTSFGAVRQSNGAVQVSWATASEQRSAYFEVQRCSDGRTFATIERVAANGTTTQTHTYACLDGQAPAGMLYYRLHQVDTDGTAVFSPVVTLAATATVTPSLYPNPTRDYLTIATAAGQAVQVLDLTGRVVQTTVLPASGELRLDALPAGTYLLGVPLPDGQRRTLRFTKE